MRLVSSDSPAIHFTASPALEAASARVRLARLYGNVPAEHADIIVALGGDGLMLQTLHAFMNTGKPIYGMNRGSVGFMMNEYREEGLLERLQNAQCTRIHPIIMRATDKTGKNHIARAINEVSLLRQTHQAAKLRIWIDGMIRMEELVCDGVLVATPAGSTAYNFSAQGPILPINSPLLALTPISPFRPRRWRGALLPNHAKVRIEVLEADKRPLAAVADHLEVRDVVDVQVEQDNQTSIPILFDPDHGFDERILAEQFGH